MVLLDNNRRIAESFISDFFISTQQIVLRFTLYRVVFSKQNRDDTN